MLFQTPNDDTLYQALLDRDPSFDGRVYVGVSSTGIFCRLTCPARKPKRQNCSFYPEVASAIAAGFRPCKRCKPLAPEANGDITIQTLTKALEENPAHRWSEGDVARMGFDPSTVRRAFKRQFGITFLEMARLSRLRDGFTTLSGGGKVIEAQLDAGYSSPSAFRTAFAKLLGLAPGKLAKDPMLKADWIDTPLGAMIAVSDNTALHLLEFADRKALPAELKKLTKAVKGNIGIGRSAPTKQVEEELKRFFAGTSDQFNTPLVLHGSDFTKNVWDALRTIPAGHTKSYSDLAKEIGRPTATRAVARANGANQIAILIPCHRVIGADGSLTGYGGGLWRKQKLIELEQQYLAR
ncbi:bifunctional transcriptional activator/DNA repair enzyme AdaA [Maritalea porphyrae]|jgi:AraC family transcriptional regulator of adaptative response/methylated-DNA-[protein]-cysteine methyltransferase|uniref:bifunctional transcriptional activator/DNA repair enzyme AdaA n=1 Tax=Maritalea porphyrae TaxID=880732 RepID=UPI0022AEE86C|nr:trifunctional transcriptional activator/DNA repair protein Ada/methylated-DNA--[protein]-cysteine S-methyltransferase [Maritalea porphyrae]MCZ4273945.1 trifunctional transcriptional activator/DNA repair protein Ada/methylated-DNA--[protein]-cysteine S-methyltransferase [Maritalea porphyrae]